MPPKRKNKQPDNSHQVVAIQDDLKIVDGSKKRRAFDASKGLTAYLGMRDRIEELEVRQFYKIGDDLMLCLDELAYITISSGSTES
jgi:hypothetical protein